MSILVLIKNDTKRMDLLCTKFNESSANISLLSIRSISAATGRNGFQGPAVDGAVGRQEFSNAHGPTQGEAQGSAL